MSVYDTYLSSTRILRTIRIKETRFPSPTHLGQDHLQTPFVSLENSRPAVSARLCIPHILVQESTKPEIVKKGRVLIPMEIGKWFESAILKRWWETYLMYQI